MRRPTRSSRSCGKPSTRSRSGISPWRGKRAIRLCAFSLRQRITGAVVRKYGGVFFASLETLPAGEAPRIS
ncbi:hypothetical protein C6P92_12080 [Burkholderia multivorans]|nr:hypothetical protein C6P92_12080 [Burkholderia multivorans]PRE57764.1 hypothetical protein C6P86_28105 [Burkholderia multivorans]PRE79837.1 hypothetical protein C6Q00_21205 [Burkholderia multivorans]PRG28810.1 hypothetical protein C6T57_00220 [Burkholderia multivorans]PRG44464.1 hypothetical protein C6T62_08190 [Burkholderia multivorans]